MALPDAETLAATYNTPSYSDPWECVANYNRVMEYAATHPEQGSSAVANALDLPRGRVRPWLDGSRPDVVRGIQTAEDHGWLNDHATANTRRALVELAAWAVSGGSLRLEPNAKVYFTLDASLEDEFDRIAADAGLTYRVIRREAAQRATEARIQENGSVLARVLATMGVPTRGKSADEPSSLPTVVNTLDHELKEAFARIYVLNRGAEHEDKATLTIREKRPESYLTELATLLREVADERVTRSGQTVTISAAAARNLLQ